MSTFQIESGDWHDQDKLEAYRAHTAKGTQGKEALNTAALEKKRLYDKVAKEGYDNVGEDEQALYDELKAADKARKEKVDKINHCFTVYDADDSKTLNIRELGRVLVECGMRRSDADQLFKAIDKDGNKEITPKEFISWVFGWDGSGEAAEAVHDRALRAIEPEEAVEEFLEFLKQLQGDGDFNEKCEAVFKTRHLKLENGAGQDLSISDLFKYMDSNANGKVSFAEFKSALATMNFAMDTALAKGVFRLMDVARKHPKGLVDAKGEPLELRDGILEASEFEQKMTA